MAFHRLLERQIKRALDIAPDACSGLPERLRAGAKRLAGEDPELARILQGLPVLFERMSESYVQHDRDLDLIRRSLDLSSSELTEANQRLREEAGATSKALASLHSALNLLLENSQETLADQETNSLVNLSQKVLLLTRQSERMRLALARSEERFELAMRGANDGLWDWGIGKNKVYYSPRWKEMIGYADDEIGDLPGEWSKRIHPDDIEDVMAAMRVFIRGDENHFETTFRFRHKDGHYLSILSRAIAVRDNEGRATRVVGTHSDITARTELERHLVQFKNALDEHAIVSMADSAGNIMYANDKFCAVSGYRREELLGKNHRQLKSGMHPPELYADLWRTISSGHVWHGEICNRGKDGSHYWVLATIAPILDADGLPAQYISIRADITANKLAESSLRQAKESAEAASLAKSQFLANVSHEIRTPMNGVLGMLDLALGTPLDPEARDYIETAHHSADSLLDIINDILDLSKIEAGRLDIHPEDFSLAGLLRHCAQLFALRCQAKGLRFIQDFGETLPESVHGDPTRLRQILVNLLGNAIKFTESGSVSLVAAVEEADRVTFSVRDTGIGIAPEHQTSIFEAFTQADGSITRKYGGTGLGLTISARLARMMGGELSMRSQLGEGSDFHFTLPLPRAAATAPRQEAPPARTGRPTRSLKILLAEDNPINQKLALLMLHKAGHHVQAVCTGRQVIEALEDAHYDLVLMDMQMPDMGGIEATLAIRHDEARRGAPRLPIIALTANAFQADRENCLAAGMDDFLTKPLRRDELLAALERADTGRKF